MLYEEPEFRGQKLVLPEGDMELRTPGTKWSPQGIGSLRRVVWVSELEVGDSLECLELKSPRPGAVTHACNAGTLGSQSRWIG